MLLLGGAADAGQDAEFAEDDDFEICALIVARKIRFGPAVVTLNEKSGVAFMLGPGGVPQDYLKLFGIVVDGDDIGLAGAADAEVAENRFLAGEGFLLGDGIPCLALGHERLRDTFPDFGGQCDSGLAIEPLFLDLNRLGELCGEEFLRRALSFVRGHGSYGLQKSIADTPS